MALSPLQNYSISGFYKDFSCQPLSHRILKVALPLVGLFLVGVGVLTLARYLKSPRHQSLPSLSYAATRGARLERPVPMNFYNGVLKNDPDMLPVQAHRWASATNLQTLVVLSTNTAYPANQIKLNHPSAVSYILAESPLNNEYVSWQADYYRMAIEKNAELLLSVASPFKDDHIHTEQYDFVTYGKPITFGDYTVECINAEPVKINGLYFANELKVSQGGKLHKIIWQLLPREAPGSSFSEIQGVVTMVNIFIKDKQITLDSQHPLLVNCRTGIDRTGRFVLFHDLQRNLEQLISDHLREKPEASSEQITDSILGTEDVSGMLIERALDIERLSTQTAAIDAIKSSVLPRFDGHPDCTAEKVNSVYRAHVLATVQNMRAHP